MQVLESARPAAPSERVLSIDRARVADLVTGEEARAELQRVLASQDFPATPRNRRFLSYVAEHALLRGSANGRVAAKEVAVQVFGRTENFDSTVDAIVRIEASKLRRDLEVYYLKSGKNNPVRIEIPRGAYDPVFVRRGKVEASAKTETAVLTGNLAEDAAAELRRVVASRDFPATERNRRFLAYIVEKELGGAPEEITAKLVAVRVFGRKASFDPSKDPIVRIEAGRLRRDLEIYYLRSGQANPLRITIPKGGYRPVFLQAKSHG
jgi:adenylate cyclase